MTASIDDVTPSVEGGITLNTDIEAPRIKAIIFDVDDTLYDVGTGFTAHRNTEGATSFMVDKLHFSSKAEAQLVRDEYFKIYHSTAKVS